jgi:NAD(P)-dependent dehydrogenase (short-subunit alcohol dehydrogenase family)
MKRMQNKVVIITGAASGIGYATAYLLAKEGASVALTDIDTSAGQEAVVLLQKQGFSAEFWEMDASHEESVQKTMENIFERFKKINVLVNNAGIIGDNKPTHELSEKEWDRVININVKSVFFCTKHVTPYLKKAGGGSIVNISSVHGLIGTPDYPANHASKGAVRLMSKTDAMLYAQDKIRVNSVHPGYIWTPLLEKVAQKSNITPEEFQTKCIKMQPLRELGEPNDIAYAVLYLASDESKFVTASELVVDGGFTGGRAD